MQGLQAEFEYPMATIIGRITGEGRLSSGINPIMEYPKVKGSQSKANAKIIIPNIFAAVRFFVKVNAGSSPFFPIIVLVDL